MTQAPSLRPTRPRPRSGDGGSRPVFARTAFSNGAGLARARGIGIALAVNIHYVTGRVLLEASSGSAQPGLGDVLDAETVTFEVHRLMQGAKLDKCSEFGSEVIEDVS